MNKLENECLIAVVTLAIALSISIPATITLTQKYTQDKMEKEAVFRHAGFYGKEGDEVKFFWYQLPAQKEDNNGIK